MRNRPVDKHILSIADFSQIVVFKGSFVFSDYLFLSRIEDIFSQFSISVGSVNPCEVKKERFSINLSSAPPLVIYFVMYAPTLSTLSILFIFIKPFPHISASVFALIYGRLQSM